MVASSTIISMPVQSTSSAIQRDRSRSAEGDCALAIDSTALVISDSPLDGNGDLEARLYAPLDPPLSSPSVVASARHFVDVLRDCRCRAPL
jgi:hypothetical protein